MAARFSRYFSPLHFNRPTTYQAVVANKDLEVLTCKKTRRRRATWRRTAPPKATS